jgi:hypothetical protein
MGQGGDVDDKARVLMSTLVGAAAGAAVGFLYLTERGQRFRRQIEPRLDSFIGEVQQLRGTVMKARAAADEGWRSLGEITGRVDREWDRTRAH